MPSTTSSSVANEFATSTVITPSLPTRCIASAIMRPISTSPLALTGDLGDLVIGRDLPRVLSDIIDDDAYRHIDTALQIHRVHPGDHRLRALMDDRLRENGRRGGAVAGELAGLHGNLLEHLGTHVLKPIGELDFFGDSSAVLADSRRSVRFVEKDIATFRSQCDLDRICERVDPRSIFSRAAVPNRTSLAAMLQPSVKPPSRGRGRFVRLRPECRLPSGSAGLRHR